MSEQTGGTTWHALAHTLRQPWHDWVEILRKDSCTQYHTVMQDMKLTDKYGVGYTYLARQASSELHRQRTPQAQYKQGTWTQWSRQQQPGTDQQDTPDNRQELMPHQLN